MAKPMCKQEQVSYGIPCLRSEYEETVNKAKALLKSIRMAEAMFQPRAIDQLAILTKIIMLTLRQERENEMSMSGLIYDTASAW